LWRLQRGCRFFSTNFSRDRPVYDFPGLFVTFFGHEFLPALDPRFHHSLLVPRQNLSIPSILLDCSSLVVGSLVAWYLLLARWVRRFSLVSSGVHHGADLLCHFFLGMAELQALIRAACSRSAILSTSSTRWRVVSHVCRDQGASPGFCDRWRFRPRVLSTPSRAVLAPWSPGLCRCWIARWWFQRYKPALVCSRCGDCIVR
jgi:hypothetical protein